MSDNKTTSEIGKNPKSSVVSNHPGEPGYRKEKSSNFIKGSRLAALTGKNLKTMFRDRAALIWLIGYPLLFIVVFSLAFGTKYDRSSFSIAIINNDITGYENPEDSWFANASLLLIDTIENNLSDTIRIRDDLGSYDDAFHEIKRENIDAIIIIDEQFSEAIIGNTWWYKLVQGLPPDQVENVTKGLSPANQAMLAAVAPYTLPAGGPELNITTVPDQVTEAVITEIFSQLVNQITLGYNNASSPEVTTSQVEDTIEITNFDYLAPGFVIAGVLVCISQLAGHFAEEKETGTLKRLITTPVARRDILLSGLGAQLVVAAVQTVLLLVLLWIFGAYFHPDTNFLLLFLIPMLFAFTSLGLGLLLASVVKAQGSAGGLAWFIILPLQFLGGLFFYFENPVMDFIPTSYAAHAMRVVMVSGVWSWDAIGTDILFLLGFGLGSTALGILLFRRKTAVL